MDYRSLVIFVNKHMVIIKRDSSSGSTMPISLIASELSNGLFVFLDGLQADWLLVKLTQLLLAILLSIPRQ